MQPGVLNTKEIGGIHGAVHLWSDCHAVGEVPFMKEVLPHLNTHAFRYNLVLLLYAWFDMDADVLAERAF